jgi:hypothetical protein
MLRQRDELHTLEPNQSLPVCPALGVSGLWQWLGNGSDSILWVDSEVMAPDEVSREDRTPCAAARTSSCGSRRTNFSIAQGHAALGSVRQSDATLSVPRDALPTQSDYAGARWRRQYWLHASLAMQQALLLLQHAVSSRNSQAATQVTPLGRTWREGG